MVEVEFLVVVGGGGGGGWWWCVQSDNHVKPNQVKVRIWLSCGFDNWLIVCNSCLPMIQTSPVKQLLNLSPPGLGDEIVRPA